MRGASIQPFAPTFVDTESTTARDQVAQQLGTSGLVALSGLTSRAAVLSFASQIMAVLPHRDSDSDGLTTIRDTGGRSQPGFAGFGSSELAPHTERSSTPFPPHLMLLVCAQPAETGGESLLADGLQVYRRLLQHQDDAVRVLSQPRTAYFGAGDGHASAVFTSYDDATVSIRLRLDSLARFSPLVRPYLPQLRAAIAQEQLPLPLLAGQGYLLDNRRWLHARSSFAGNRVCWRALGEPLFNLPRGFPLEPAATAPSWPSQHLASHVDTGAA